MVSMMEQEKKVILLEHYLLYVVYDGAREKTHFNIIFWMLSMMEEEKTLIVLENYFFYIVYDGGKEKTRSFVQFIFLWCL